MFNSGEIRDSLSRSGTATLQDAQYRKVGLEARLEYQSVFRNLPLHSPRESFDYADLQNDPWRKVAIGSTNGVGEAYAQVLQTTYFSSTSDQFPALKLLFNMLISLRNELLGLDQTFGTFPERDGFWNACRIHHYPRGGGFMVSHRDTHFPRILSQAQVPFLQVMCLLSEMGSDFNEGGSFVKLKDGSMHFPEVEAGIGTVIMFDGSIEHGVADVDPNTVLDFNSPDGRIAAFVNLYEYRS